METGNQFQDKHYLRNEQYRDSSNLDARAQLHQRFSTSQVGWFEWVADHLALNAGQRILECGCGPGWQWRNTLTHIPPGCTITLTDLSDGMVAEAQTALADTAHDFRFESASIMALPFPDDSFDLVVANHMLYHVADRPLAFAEVTRVLAPGGRFVCATNGDAHMIEMHLLRRELLPHLEFVRMGLPFTLENGRDQLTTAFSTAERFDFFDDLIVTEREPLIAYILSIKAENEKIDEARLSAVADTIQQTIDTEGAYRIQKATGLFVCQP